MNFDLSKKSIELIKKIIQTEFEKIKDSLSTSNCSATLEQDHYNCSEVASMLKISKSTVWNWRNSGKLPSIRIGGKVFFSKDNILKLKQGDYFEE